MFGKVAKAPPPKRPVGRPKNQVQLTPGMEPPPLQVHKPKRRSEIAALEEKDQTLEAQVAALQGKPKTPSQEEPTEAPPEACDSSEISVHDDG